MIESEVKDRFAVKTASSRRVRSHKGTRLAKPRPCPHCGKADYYKHDARSLRFDILITEDGFEDVTVSIKRYWCKQRKTS
ncbi:hypothetical protein BBD46_06400 [Natrialba sp. SSL1]|nr:hypothetical protein BBD46_06400 [Natrialba sp. SSL1]